MTRKTFIYVKECHRFLLEVCCSAFKPQRNKWQKHVSQTALLKDLPLFFSTFFSQTCLLWKQLIDRCQSEKKCGPKMAHRFWKICTLKWFLTETLISFKTSSRQTDRLWLTHRGYLQPKGQAVDFSVPKVILSKSVVFKVRTRCHLVLKQQFAVWESDKHLNVMS